MEPRLQEVEAVLLSQPSVDDCAVRLRTVLDGSERIIAYVVLLGPYVPEALRAQVQKALPESLWPWAYIPLTAVPVARDGEIDETMLATFPVINSDVSRLLEQRLVARGVCHDATVLIAERRTPEVRLHIFDLLPTNLLGATKSSVSAPLYIDSRAGINSKTPAISHGGPLRDAEKIPKTLPGALERAAATRSGPAITYIQPEGPAITKSYGELLEEAERIFAGLKELGLRPQDKVILQLGKN